MRSMKSMKWMGIMIVVLSIIAAPTSALAHTGLKASTPAGNQVADTEVEEIVMSFNTGIEAKSSFKVTDAQGNEHELSSNTVKGSTMSGTLEKPLTDGEYTVDWKIIGEDGHPIKGSFGFRVAVPVVESPAPSASESSAPAPSEASEPAPSASGSSSPTAAPSEQADAEAAPSEGASLEAKSTASNLLLYAAGAVFILILILYLRRKKQ
ncbi:copper resistance CopC family protein [Cohnella boryungensis]